MDSDAEECEGFLGRLYNSLVARHKELSPELVEEGLTRACAESTRKETTGEVSRPLSAHVPVSKICQKLQRSDAQICELRYDRAVLDWSTDALSKMRVLELKRVLASWGEECRACLEKNEFIALIQEVAPKHSSAQHRTRTEEL
ncbi:hypothetical protein DNTS_026862 [Danionella cerebrum]|uniref:Cerebral dopamine neurotrophic factor n=1 Tax=Danionella cerebrum TaxID=2873325 RepID=A0A553MS37_9TELE|nr:hypothetical protein DNTS_026862 [Danionella translucida]